MWGLLVQRNTVQYADVSRASKTGYTTTLVPGQFTPENNLHLIRSLVISVLGHLGPKDRTD